MDNSELDNIFKEYIDEKYSVEELHRGYAHKKWIITGENETIFLKSFNDISKNRIEFINYIQDYLKLYTPNLIKNKKNCTYTQLNNKTYVAYELLNGKSIPPWIRRRTPAAPSQRLWQARYLQTAKKQLSLNKKRVS